MEHSQSMKDTGKIHKVMHEFKHGTLHSGSKSGPTVKSRAQAVAIAISEQKKQNAGGYSAKKGGHGSGRHKYK